VALTLAAAALAVRTSAPATPAAPVPPPSDGAPCEAVETISELPYEIDAPGTYCVTEDLTAGEGEDGITVRSSDVVIDLNGYRLVADGGAYGVRASPSYSNVTVKNGILGGWQERAVLLEGSCGRVSGVEATSVAQSGSGGIDVGTRSLIECCLAVGVTVGGGFDAGRYSTIRSCRAFSCLRGFDVSEYGTIEDCSGQDVEGILFSVNTNSRMTRCSGSDAGDGINANPGCVIDECAIERVERIGISVQPRTLVRNCEVRDAEIGVALASGARATGVVASECGTGFQLSAFNWLSECIARGNTGDGFTPRTAGPSGGPRRLVDCLAEGNGGDGICIADWGEVIRSTSHANGGAGVRVEGDAARVEDCRLSENGVGIEVVGVDNLIIRNSLSGNAVPYSIPPGNTRGPFLTTNDWIQSTNPWANFNLSFPN